MDPYEIERVIPELDRRTTSEGLALAVVITPDARVSIFGLGEPEEYWHHQPIYWPAVVTEEDATWESLGWVSLRDGHHNLNRELAWKDEVGNLGALLTLLAEGVRVRGRVFSMDLGNNPNTPPSVRGTSWLVVESGTVRVYCACDPDRHIGPKPNTDEGQDPGRLISEEPTQ